MQKYYCDKCHKEIGSYLEHEIRFRSNSTDRDPFEGSLDLCKECFDRLWKVING